MAVFWAADMLTQEQAVEIRILARQGESIRQISRRTGLSRNTVRRYLRDAEAARYGPRALRVVQARSVHRVSGRARRAGAAGLDSGDGAAA